MLHAAYPAAVHVEVVGFASSTQRSSYPKGSLVRCQGSRLMPKQPAFLLQWRSSCCLASDFARLALRLTRPRPCCWQHRGFALVVLAHPREGAAAAEAIAAVQLGPEPLLAQPAQKTPEEWPAEYTCGRLLEASCVLRELP